MRLPGLDREFAWGSIIEIGAAETRRGDVITITCDKAGVRQHRRDGFVSAGWRPTRREPDGPWLVPVDYWGVGSVGLFEALMCLWEDLALRDELSPELLTGLLIDGFESGCVTAVVIRLVLVMPRDGPATLNSPLPIERNPR